MFTLFSSRFSKLALGLVVLFTVVEIVTLVAWLIFALPSGALSSLLTTRGVVAVVILAVGLTVEHFLSAATGTHISTNETKPGSN